MVFVAFFYGVGFFWGDDNIQFVLVNGTLLGLVFCLFATISFFGEDD